MQQSRSFQIWKLNGFLIKSKILKSDNPDDYLVAVKKLPSQCGWECLRIESDMPFAI